MEKDAFFAAGEEGLREILAALHAFSELPVQLLRADGSPAAAFGKGERCCALLNRHAYRPGECRELHRRAGECARRQGEAYVFSCRAGLSHVSFPLARGGETAGSVLVGPFLMEAPDSAFVAALMEAAPLVPETALEIYEEAQGLRVVSPRRVAALGRLLERLLAPLRLEEDRPEERSHGEDEPDLSCYQQEARMLACVRAGEEGEADACLEALLRRTAPEELPERAQRWIALLSRAAMDGGAEPERADRSAQRALLLLRTGREDAGPLLREAVARGAQAVRGACDGGSPHVRKALRIMAERYQQPLTMAAVAAEVGLSANYFSSLFRRATGESFSERLNRVRVEEGKRLLLATEDSAAQIAAAVGFADQSYFSKVFRRYTGMSPGRFRA